jgi:hypothetical protein
MTMAASWTCFARADTPGGVAACVKTSTGSATAAHASAARKDVVMRGSLL